MNNTKSPKNVSLKNQLELWLFCALIGTVAGALVWILLKIMADLNEKLNSSCGLSQ